jgi:hypothetical protein
MNRNEGEDMQSVSTHCGKRAWLAVTPLWLMCAIFAPGREQPCDERCLKGSAPYCPLALCY